MRLFCKHASECLWSRRNENHLFVVGSSNSLRIIDRRYHRFGLYLPPTGLKNNQGLLSSPNGRYIFVSNKCENSIVQLEYKTSYGLYDILGSYFNERCCQVCSVGGCSVHNRGYKWNHVTDDHIYVPSGRQADNTSLMARVFNTATAKLVNSICLGGDNSSLCDSYCNQVAGVANEPNNQQRLFTLRSGWSSSDIDVWSFSGQLEKDATDQMRHLWPKGGHQERRLGR